MRKTVQNGKSCYDILKIAPDASDRDIRDAYLNLARIYHPDANPNKRACATSKFRMINEAYDVLKTPHNRQRYDQLLRQKATKKTKPFKAHNDNPKPKTFGFMSGLIKFMSVPTPQTNTMRTRK